MYMVLFVYFEPMVIKHILFRLQVLGEWHAEHFALTACGLLHRACNPQSAFRNHFAFTACGLLHYVEFAFTACGLPHYVEFAFTACGLLHFDSPLLRAGFCTVRAGIVLAYKTLLISHLECKFCTAFAILC